MNPPIYERLRWVFHDAGLTDGYDVQLLFYDDPVDEYVSVLLFQPGGGTAVRHDLGADVYVTVSVVGARSRRRETTNHAQRIINYFQDNPMPSDCVGYVQSMNGLPTPIQTEEGRIVYQLLFSCTYGE